MAMFEIEAIRQDGQKTVFYYDNETSNLTHRNGKPVVNAIKVAPRGEAVITSKNTPVGKVSPKTLKVSLGLSCNYECEYCSQRFVPHAEETNPSNVNEFIVGLDAWVTSAPERIEFWGGEPLVYIKTLRPLAEALKAKYPQAEMSIITNGSLLTLELNEWLDKMGFAMAISHDGPGQHVRGPDPLDDPQARAAILDLYHRLSPTRRISFNTMMNRQNTSRAAVQKFFVELTGDANVPIGEGSFVDAYDEGGLANSLREDEFSNYRNRAFAELRSGQAANFVNLTQRVSSFVNSIRTRRPSNALGQKCGMDHPENIAVDLKGNVLTCQNVSVAGMAPNGESHKLGNVSDMSSVKLTTATHWSKREQCPKCPMLQVCAGSCMFLEGDLWEASCNNAFSDAVPVFAAGIEFLTGFAPLKIAGPHRADRHDIWKAPAAASSQKKKIIPIALAA